MSFISEIIISFGFKYNSIFKLLPWAQTLLIKTLAVSLNSS